MKTERIVLIAAVGLLAMVVCGDALAQTVNLNGAFSQASSQLRSYAKTGMTVAGFISTTISLGIAGWKFMNKEPNAVWQVVGVVVGGVLFMVGQSL